MKIKKILFVLLASVIIVGPLVVSKGNASETAQVSASVSIKSISISIAPDSFTYGPMDTSATKRATSVVGVDQVRVTNDSNVNVDLDIYGGNTTGGGTNWTLSPTAIGADTYMHEFTTNINEPVWTKLNVVGQSAVLGTNIAQAGTRDFDLRMNTPSSVTESGVTLTVPVTVIASENN
ncbi:MAG: hypothetical protein QY321_00690 [Patescibacteria group bacterium]|nr:MAG: hypothetical protein QY321_00690 [Patescibacteria group bacterium]